MDRLERDAELVGDGTDLAAIGRKRKIIEFHGSFGLSSPRLPPGPKLFGGPEVFSTAAGRSARAQSGQELVHLLLLPIPGASSLAHLEESWAARRIALEPGEIGALAPAGSAVPARGLKSAFDRNAAEARASSTQNLKEILA
ncbi:hypothetical protein [Sorangium atrum]|uniref:Uncharacterized protein n=1 Tax=Sorangium atrum TaxID=2995308 RepID=A0ABT5CF14_9BACT|nr:hypothetical protein [Sorangium aterium]MDC0684995.1 hypothetical protein [Sorangium aterium]